jgi:hypothetical protein
MGADLAASAWSAALELAVFLAGQVDRAEGGCCEGGEHAWVGGDAVGDALAARQSGADELVGVGAVHLRARWAARRAAGLTRNRQDPAGLVDGRITVQQFPGGSIDVIDTAAQQDGLDAPACLPVGSSGEGKDGQRWYSSRRGGRAEADLCQVQKYRVRSDQQCNAATGLARLPVAQAVLVCGFGTVTGHPVHPPARHRTVIPRCGGVSYGADTTRTSNFSPTLTVSDTTRRALEARLGVLPCWSVSTVAGHYDSLGSASEPVDCQLPWVKDILQSRRVT